jgi:hypothetical protein
MRTRLLASLVLGLACDSVGHAEEAKQAATDPFATARELLKLPPRPVRPAAEYAAASNPGG